MFMFRNCLASRYCRFEEYGCCYIAILQLLGIRVLCLGLRGHFLGALGLRFLFGQSCYPGLLRSGVSGCFLRIIRGDRIAPVLMLISLWWGAAP